jgi:hypothetical protein
MSDQRKYLRKVKALADEVHSAAMAKKADIGSDRYKIIVESTNLKWLKFCRCNKKAHPNAFKQYIELCQ